MALASLTMASAALADVGGTKDQSISNWGTPQQAGQFYVYHYEGWTIMELYNEAGRAIVSAFYTSKAIGYDVARAIDSQNMPSGVGGHENPRRGPTRGPFNVFSSIRRLLRRVPENPERAFTH